MPPLYQLAIVSPDRVVYQRRVQSLIAPGAEGYFGVLARHAPMVAELGVGVLELTDDHGARRAFAVSGGLLEVIPDGVTVYADAAEGAQEIDVERARAARARAQERLRSRAADVDAVRAEAALRRALNRLRTAEQGQQRAGR